MAHGRLPGTIVASTHSGVNNAVGKPFADNFAYFLGTDGSKMIEKKGDFANRVGGHFFMGGGDRGAYFRKALSIRRAVDSFISV